MGISEWAHSLETNEKGYVSQCFKFWNGTNGGQEPPIPVGISRSRADILRFHTKSLNDGQTGRRKMEESKPFSIRITDSLKKDLAFEAAEIDITISEYVIRCINIGRPIVLAFPDLSKLFEKPRLQR